MLAKPRIERLEAAALDSTGRVNKTSDMYVVRVCSRKEMWFALSSMVALTLRETVSATNHVRQALIL